MSKSHLTAAEMYKLTKYIETRKESFPSWKQAIHASSAEMGREVSRSNIETAANSCGVSLDALVEPASDEHPFAKMMARVRDLERRVTELESFIRS